MEQSDLLFKPKRKNKNVSYTQSNHNWIKPTLSFISIFVYKNFFPLPGKFYADWKFYVLLRI